MNMLHEGFWVRRSNLEMALFLREPTVTGQEHFRKSFTTL